MRRILQGRSADRAVISQHAENDDHLSDAVIGTDDRLIAEVARGNVGAFTILVERHTPALYRVAYRMLRDGGEAEDVVQECFARLWISTPNWRSKGAGLVGWLHRVAINQCFDRLRKRTSVIAEIPEIIDTSLLPDEYILGYEAASAVEYGLASLPQHYRAALVLSYYEGFPNAVTAEIMEMNLKAFESLLVRARRQLRKVLEEQEFTPADIEALA